jgi:glycosyltransferase involved in cell wall biosynthesis
MRILFVSRAYPPVTGGIENQNYELSVWLPRLTETRTIANTRGKKFLPLFLPYALVKTAWLMRQYDVLLLGDGVLAIVGWFIKQLYPRKTVISIVHGLDITYTSSLYQSLWIRRFLPKLDRLIAVGNETLRAGVARGIPEEKFVFIPNGVDTEKYFKPHTREELGKILGESIEGKHILLTSGRLAKRKGVAWFIEHVLPKLPENVHYVVAGAGPGKDHILTTIQKSGMETRVKMLGYVSDETRDILFNTCDLFIQPNIRIEGDMEGFGISVIEAASCELPVIASKLEGLKDAIIDGKNGFLVEPENAEAYVTKITELLNRDDYRKEFGKQARQFVIEHYRWDKIARQYLQIMQNILGENSK